MWRPTCPLPARWRPQSRRPTLLPCLLLAGWALTATAEPARSGPPAEVAASRPGPVAAAAAGSERMAWGAGYERRKDENMNTDGMPEGQTPARRSRAAAPDGLRPPPQRSRCPR